MNRVPYATSLPSNDRGTWYEWHSTPQLWAAYRDDYDGAPDSHCPVGYGKTKADALDDLLDQEANRDY